MKNKALLVCILAIFTVLISCEKTEKIEDFPLYPPKLVLNSFLNPDSTVSFQLSKSLSVLDNADLKKVNDGSLELYEDELLISVLTISDGDGIYRSSIKPKAGSNYRVKASAPKLSTVQAKTSVPTPLTIQKFYINETNTSEWQSSYKFSVKITDPTNEKNYYMLSAHQTMIDTAMNGTDTMFFETYSESVWFSSSSNPALSDVFLGKAFFTDEFFDGKTYTLDANVDYLYLYAYKVRIVITIYLLSKEEYLYRYSLNKYRESNGNPFAEPVQVYNNIEGGYGIFGAENLKTDTIFIRGISYSGI